MPLITLMPLSHWVKDEGGYEGPASTRISAHRHTNTATACLPASPTSSPSSSPTEMRNERKKERNLLPLSVSRSLPYGDYCEKLRLWKAPFAAAPHCPSVSTRQSGYSNSEFPHNPELPLFCHDSEVCQSLLTLWLKFCSAFSASCVFSVASIASEIYKVKRKKELGILMMVDLKSAHVLIVSQCTACHSFTCFFVVSILI